MPHRATPLGIGCAPDALRGSRECRRWCMQPLLCLVGAVLLALAVLGCGGASGHSTSSAHRTSAASHQSTSSAHQTSAAKPSACRPAAVAALRAELRVPVSAIHTRVTTDNSHQPECVFSVPARRLKMSVSVSTEPQPYAVLERQAEEASQMFTPTRLSPAPQQVAHLGLDAQWFPELEQLLTTDAVRLITVTIVHWPGASQARWKRLAAVAARPYLGRLQPKLARGPSPCDCASP
jgi:hypothetical protein